MARGRILDWLERLQQLGLVRLTPPQVEACARLVAKEELWRSEKDLAEALASLLASDPETYAAIREHFLHGRVTVRPRRSYSTSAPPPPARSVAPRDAPPPPRPLAGFFLRSGRSGTFWGGVLALVIVGGVVTGPSALSTIGDSISHLVETRDAGSGESLEKEEQEARAEPARERSPPASSKTARVELLKGSQVDTVSSAPTGQDTQQEDPSTLPGPTWLRLLLLGLTPLLGLLAGRWWQASTAFKADIDRANSEASRAREAAQEGGRALGTPYNIRRELWFDPGAIDDAATILARRRLGVPGDDLDVDRTLCATIEAGGRLSPVFAPGERRAPPIVLVDTEETGHPYLDAVDLILQRWRAGGLVFDRYDFEFEPEHIRVALGRPSFPLEDLTRRSEDRPLLVFSRFRQPDEYDGRRRWPYLLRSWPLRAWIDLDPRTLDEHADPERHLREDLHAHIPRFAFSADGLLEATRHLTLGEPVAATPEDPLPPVEALEEHLWRWAACAALVPDPTWHQLEAVRRDLEPLAEALPDPRLVQRLIEWAENEGLAIGGKSYHLGSGPRLAFDKLRRGGLLRRLSEHDAGTTSAKEEKLAWRARALLIDQLEAADLSHNPHGEALRLAKIAFHCAVMHPEQARELLAAHSEGAAGREVKELALEQVELQDGGASLAGAWNPDLQSAVRGWSTSAPKARLGDLVRLRPGGWRALARALPWGVVAGLSALLWWGEHAGRWDLLPEVAPEPPSAEEVEGVERYVTTPALWKVERIEGGKAADDNLVALADVAPLRLVRLPGGSFMMGSPETEADRDTDEMLHRTRVGAFEIGIHEVTLVQWEAVMKSRPNNCDDGCADDLPVTNVSWHDACRFTVALTERENARRRAHGEVSFTPCYVADSETCEWPVANRDCTGYRLPSEAEWEYAARAGTSTAYSFGNSPGGLCTYGNVDRAPCDDGYSRLAPVGKFAPNPWKLHDVHGNVYEWVWDWYGQYPVQKNEASAAGGDRHVYAGPERGESRVLRGGSYWNQPRGARSGNRYRLKPTDQAPDVGFRVVRGP